MPRMDLGLPYTDCNHQPCPAGFQSPNLLRCGGCSVVKYCGQAHQKADRPKYKVQCIPITQQKKRLAEEEAKLRANPGADTGGQNPFDNIMGNFWFYTSTSPYLQARFDHISVNLNARTSEAAKAALNESLEML